MGVQKTLFGESENKDDSKSNTNTNGRERNELFKNNLIRCFRRESGQKVFPIGEVDENNNRKIEVIYNTGHDGNSVCSINGIAKTQKSLGGGQGGKGGLYAVPVLTPNREEKRQNGRRFKENGDPSFTLTGQDIHGVMMYDDYNSKIRKDKMAVTLTSNCGSKAERTGQKIMLRDGRDNRSCLKSGRNTELGVEGMSIRRLTPVECERLQGFPDSWTAKGIDDDGNEVDISDSQRYKMCGNAVTVNVIEQIFNRIIQRGDFS